MVGQMDTGYLGYGVLLFSRIILILYSYSWPFDWEGKVFDECLFCFILLIGSTHLWAKHPWEPLLGGVFELDLAI